MLISILLCLTVHETCHGLAAYALGDPTAKREHRLSLNPLHHIDWFGLAAMLMLGFGWAKPVPVNMQYFKHPKRGMALTALAGPMCNVLITVVFLALYGALFLPLRQSAAGDYLLQMILLTARISLGLAIFNLLPVPPLDGSKILLSLLPDEKYRVLLRYERYGSLLLFALVATGLLGTPLTAVINAVYRALIPLAQGTMKLVEMLFYR
jgi:Zn-dependent protease